MPSKNVMHKFKAGQLHSGGPSGPVAKNRKQANLAQTYNKYRKGGK